MANLYIGSKGNDVLELQRYLQNNGLYHGNLDGSFGPQTLAAVRAFQSAHNIKVDGIVGPQTRSTMLGKGNFYTAQQNSQQQGGPNVDQTDKQAYDQYFNESNSELNPYYQQDQAKATADVQSSLANSQANYDAYLKNAAAQFQSDKAQQDQTSAQNGVLFSSGRVQRLNNLQSQYENDQAQKLANYKSQVGQTARDYQYQYGNDSANGLSNYYNYGGNTYNAMQARNNTGSTGLSSVYNPSAYNFDGLKKNEQYTNATLRAQNKLANYQNKKLLNSYNYQF